MTTWQGCYDDNWNGQIVPEAFSHPAKMANGLVNRIFDYAIAKGWIVPGESVVVDPFGGIGSTGIIGASRGVQVLCCELEQKFVDLAKRNFELHRRTWEACGDPLPVIVQGDSRKLCEVLGPALADCICSSPPYAQNRMDGGDVKMDKPARKGYDYNAGGDGVHAQYGTTEGQLGAMRAGDVAAVIGSPPFTGCRGTGPEAEKLLRDNYATRSTQATSIEATEKQAERFTQTYGDSAGQLSAMPTGSVDAVVSSPPYADQATNGARANREANLEAAGIDSKAWLGKRRCTQGRSEGYGETDGNLGNLPAGDVAAIISSPDYVNSDTQPTKLGAGKGTRRTGDGAGRNKGDYLYSTADGKLGSMPPGDVADAIVSSPPYEGRGTGNASEYTDEEKARRDASRDIMRCKAGKASEVRYGTSDGQLGDVTGETFWSAAHAIVTQCYHILRPGGIAIWVVKAFVRNAAIVDFPGDWLRLCEACGFTFIEEIHASLVKEDSHPGLFGEPVVKRTERKGFFRRLHQKKYPHLAIDWEVVLVVRKPDG